MSWNVSADGDYYVFEGIVMIPLDVSTGVAQLLLRPQGGMLIGVPAIEKGDPGVHAEVDTTINFTALAYNDVTPDSASFTVITPPTEDTPGVYRLNLALHNGSPGTSGTTSIDISTIGGSAVTGKMIVVNSAATGFDFAYQRIGDRYLPSVINTTVTSGAASLALVSVPAQNFDWRPHCEGYTIVTGTGTNVTTDLYARLNGETGGNIVAACSGRTSTERLVLASAPPAGAADGFDRVAAGAAATIHLRTERQTGSDTYAVSAATTRFAVRVQPI